MRLGVAGNAGCGPVRHGSAARGMARQVWRGSVGLGAAGRGVAGMARLGGAGLGKAGCGAVRQAWEKLKILVSQQNRGKQGTMVTKDPVISIKGLDAESLNVPIIGTAPLIVNNWSEKTRKRMLDAMQGKKNPKENKNPQAEYEATLYRIYREAPARSRTAKQKSVEAYGFPVIAFKATKAGPSAARGTSAPNTDRGEISDERKNTSRPVRAVHVPQA